MYVSPQATQGLLVCCASCLHDDPGLIRHDLRDALLAVPPREFTSECTLYSHDQCLSSIHTDAIKFSAGLRETAQKPSIAALGADGAVFEVITPGLSAGLSRPTHPPVLAQNPSSNANIIFVCQAVQQICRKARRNPERSLVLCCSARRPLTEADTGQRTCTSEGRSGPRPIRRRGLHRLPHRFMPVLALYAPLWRTGRPPALTTHTTPTP